MIRKVHLLIISFAFLFCSQLTGQTKMSDVFAAMPDSIIPYMTKNNRLDCIDFLQSNMEAVVTNALGGKCKMHVLTDDSLCLQTSDISSIEMKLQPRKETNDTIICMKKIFLLPEKDIRETHYTLDWNLIDGKTLE